MADSPGRLLSSICLGGGGGGGGYGSGSDGRRSSSRRQSAKYGCVNVFLHLFDWNRRLYKRGLFSKKLLPSTLEGAGQSGRRRGRKSRSSKAMVVASCEDRLPMAKLLLIADENRRNGRTSGSNCTGKDQEKEEEEEEEAEPAEEDNDENKMHNNTAASNNCRKSSSSSSSSDRFFPCSAEIRSLQELLHIHDQDDSHFTTSRHELPKPAEQKPLFCLLLEEVKSSPPGPSHHRKKIRSSRKSPTSGSGGGSSSNSLSRQVSSERHAFSRRASSRRSSLSSPLTGSLASRKCPGVATVASVGVASSGCGAFSRRTSGLFLEAAAKILDPRGRSSKSLTRVLSGGHLPPVARKKTSDASTKVTAVLGQRSSDEMEKFEGVDRVERIERRHRRSFEVVPSDFKASSSTTRSVSAPCSPGPREEGIDFASSASIRSLMELFLDDLEEDLEVSHLSRAFAPRYHPVPETSSPSLGRSRSIHLPEKVEDVPKLVTIDNLKDDDYVSFREFLTSSSLLDKTRPKTDSSPATPTEVDEEETSTSTDMTTTTTVAEHEQQDCCGTSDRRDNHGFMVHNPLFQDNCSLDNYSDDLEDRNEDDQGLEDILKSILSDQVEQQRDTSRLKWLPDSSSNLAAPENFAIYNNSNSNNKDGSSSCSDESHQLDNDSVELTSESNCGEDCGQPSPVSVLDSPFDDELPAKRSGRRGPSSSTKSSRKRLDFSDDRQTASVPNSSSSSSASIARFQKFDTNALEEAEEYIAMILEESGICYHANVMTLLVAEATSTGCSDESTEFNAGIVGSSVFDRLEDRLRVQQLIEHLESCSTSSSAEERPSHHSLGSLRAHYESYHESRSRRRMVFDFVNETLGCIVAKHLEDRHSRQVMCGEELARETHSRALQWKREAFESIQELIEIETKRVSNSVRSNCSGEVCDIGLSCEQHIFKSIVEEVARDLLDLHSITA